jgi:hypothetical protein
MPAGKLAGQPRRTEALRQRPCALQLALRRAAADAEHRDAACLEHGVHQEGGERGRDAAAEGDQVDALLCAPLRCVLRRSAHTKRSRRQAALPMR